MQRQLEFKLGRVYFDGLDMFLVARNGGTNPVFLRGTQQEDYIDFTQLKEFREEELGILSEVGYKIGRANLSTQEVETQGSTTIQMRVPENFKERYTLSQ